MGGCLFLIVIIFFPGIFAGALALLGLNAVVQSGASQPRHDPAIELSTPENYPPESVTTSQSANESRYLNAPDPDSKQESFVAYYADDVYHKHKTCKGLDGQRVGAGISVQLQSRGMKPCELCMPVPAAKSGPGPVNTTIVYTANQIYHRNKYCDDLVGLTTSPALEPKAIELYMKPCSLCSVTAPPHDSSSTKTPSGLPSR